MAGHDGGARGTTGRPPEGLVECDRECAYWLEAAEARPYAPVGQVIEGLDEVG